MRRLRSILGISLALSALACAADGPLEPGPENEVTSMSEDTRAIALEPSGEGEPGLRLDLRLEAAPPAAPPERPVRAAATSLDAEAAKALLARLPPADRSDEPGEAFRLPPEGPPPPRAGETRAAAFPPPPGEPGDLPQPVEDQRPLAVERVVPEGEVPIARDVQIQLSHAMVPLAAPSALDRKVPVRLEPEPPGAWRWVDPHTLVFEPEGGRLPAATAYEVRVPAGITAQDGRTLDEAVEARFRTARPAVESHLPKDGEEGVSTRPVIVLGFTQAIDPEAIVGAARLSVNGDAGPKLTLAPAAELDGRARRLFSRLGEDRAVALVPGAALPPEAKVRLTLEAGPWSAEGPLPAEAPFDLRFRVHGPLEVTATECGWEGVCRPGMPLSVRFSNRLAEDGQPEPAAIVRPESKSLEVRVEPHGVFVTGLTEALTTYTVELDPALLDEHGQRLGETEPLRFEVQGAQPFLQGPDGGAVLRRLPGQATAPVISAGAEALDVRIHRVGPEDWPEWQAFMRNRDEGASPPGAEVFAGEVEVAGTPERIVETAIDLGPALGEGGGMAAVEVSAPVGRNGRARRLRFWAVVSDRFVDAWSDARTLYVAVTDARGAPLANEEVRLEPGGPRAETGPDGLARLPLPEAPLGPSPWIETASGGFLPEGAWPNGRSFARRPEPPDAQRVLTVDDRGLYRPGETAHLKGWARTFDLKEGLQPLPEGAVYAYEARGPRGNAWAEGEVRLGPWGSFALEIEVPEDANLGRAQVRFRPKSAPSRRGGGEHVHVLRVEAFRRPRFEVELDVEAGPQVIGRSFSATARAAAYAGGPLADAPVQWAVTEREARFSPPGWDGWRFGRSFPFWWDLDVLGRGSFGPMGRGERTERVEGQTAADGRSRLVLEPRGASEPFPVYLDIRAEVADVDRRAVAATGEALVHPGERYAGLRPKKTFLAKGEALELEVVAVDHEGAARAGAPLQVSLHPSPGFGPRLDEVKPAVAACERSSGADPRACRFDAPDPGRYLLRAEATDARGRVSRTETTVYWAGRPAERTARAETDALEIAPDRESYAAGDTAVLTVRSPLPEGQGAWLAVSDGVLRFEPFAIEDGVGEIRLPLTRRMAPEVAVEVWIAGAGPGGAPRSAAGRVGLEVGLPQDVLTVEVEPAAPAAAPGSATSVTITVKDAEGAPVVGAEVTLAVVDEAVLALSGAEWPDPLEALRPGADTRVRAWHPREELRLDRRGPEGAEAIETDAALDTGMARMALGGALMAAEAKGAPGGGGDPAPIDLRADLRPLAHFEPSAVTGAEGRAVVRFTLPDDLTRYRARAIAASKDGARFGRGEASFVARLPLSVESGLPRFLSFGDRPELPFIVRNRTGAPLAARLALDADGLALRGPLGFAFSVPANDRVELRFPADVARVGKARLRAALEGGEHEDAVAAVLPVYAPATREAFAEHGSLAGGAIERDLALPADAASEVGGLELEVASTRLLAAKDAFRQVVEYPFLCAEQRASRVLVTSALGQLRAFFAGGDLPSVEELRAMAERDLAKLLEQQRGDGGWGFWPRARRSDPFITAHVLHALLRARRGGLEVPAPALARAAAWLREMRLDDHLRPETQAALRAHAEWVLAGLRAIEDVEGGARADAIDLALELGGGPAEAPTEVLGWLHGAAVRGALSPALQEKLRKALANRITVTARTAHLVSAYEAGGELVLSGEHRADAIFLLGLLESRPKDPLVEKLLAGLVAGRGPEGAWGHTQENAWVLLAVAAYAEVYESTPPRFTARMWLGDRIAFEETLRGREAARRKLEVPMAWLERHPDRRELVLGMQGKGRMYYRLGLAFAPEDLRSAPESRGFTVHRRFEGVDDADDVTRTEEGWRIRAGARVRVRLEVVARGPRHHVAVVDRLPAGLEPLHPSLDRLEPLPALEGDPRPGPWDWWRGWDHENLRDTGAEAFLVHMGPGLRRYDYVARATVPGRFVAAPARAEEMYAPETFGRTGAEIVEVK